MMMLGFEKCSSLTQVFENREKGKIEYYCIYYVFGDFIFKVAAWREDAFARPNSGDSLILEQCHANVVVGGSHTHFLVRDEASTLQSIAFGCMLVAGAMGVAS